MDHYQGLFAHGSAAAPQIVSSFERAKSAAQRDAIRSGQPAPVYLVHLLDPERSIEIRGMVHPDGRYVESRDLPTSPSSPA